MPLSWCENYFCLRAINIYISIFIFCTFMKSCSYVRHFYSWMDEWRLEAGNDWRADIGIGILGAKVNAIKTHHPTHIAHTHTRTHSHPHTLTHEHTHTRTHPHTQTLTAEFNSSAWYPPALSSCSSSTLKINFCSGSATYVPNILKWPKGEEKQLLPSPLHKIQLKKWYQRISLVI